MQRKQRSFIAILSFVLIMLTTYAYSALATNLSITGEANFRKVADIRVTNISINGASGATSEYENYKKDTITAGFTLNNTSSTMTYNVTITNNGDIDQAIYNLTTQSSNNSGLSILIDGQPINQALPIIVPFGTSRTITITYSSTTPGRVDVVNKFDFREVYYITYNLKGGSSSNSDLINGQIKYQNANLTITNATPTKAGYVFKGWTDEQNGTTVKIEPGDTYTIDGSDKILYAIYEEDSYTITLNAGDGTIASTSGWTINGSSATKEVDAGTEIGTLPTVQKDGYQFDGWYDSNNTRITSETIPSANTTYTAHYTANKLTINYYANGAQKNNGTTINNQKLTTDTYDYDGTDLATTGLKNYDGGTGATWNLSKTGYTASKYYHIGSANNNTKIHENTNFAKIQDLADAMGKLSDLEAGDVEVNIYAGWTANTYQVAFNANGGTGTMSNQSFTYDENAKALTENIFTKTGYTFTGWNTQADGQGTPYLDEEQVRNLTSTNNETVTLYAQWISNKYYLTYDYQDNYSYNGTNVLDTGYKYDWSKNFKIESKFKVTTLGKRYLIFGNYDNGENTLNFEITMGNKLRIYMGNAALDNGSTDAIPANTDITATYTWNASTKSYTLTATGTNVNISMNGTISSMTGTATNNVLVGRDTRTNVFNPISISMFKISTEYNYDTLISTLPTISKTGYTYSGWYDASTGGNKVTSVTMPSSNKTIYAHSVANTYQVAFNANGGTGAMSNQSFTYDENEKALTENIFTKTGYTFTGWNTQADGQGTPYLDEESVRNLTSTNNATVTLYAQWILTNYSITYTMNNGNVGEECASEGGTCTFSGTKEVCFGSGTNYTCTEATDSIGCNSTAFGGDPASGTFKYCYIKSTNPTSYNMETNTFTLNPATKIGHTFAGWTGSNGNTPQTSVSIAKGSTGDKSYTANYTPKNYTLTINPNGGTYNGSTSNTIKTLTYGSTNNNSIGVPTRTGYTFAGWSTPHQMYNTSGNAISGPYWTSGYPSGTFRGLSNITATAQWTPNTYTITYDHNYLPNDIMSSTYNINTYNGCCNSSGSITSAVTSADEVGRTFTVTSINQGWYFGRLSDPLETDEQYTWSFEAKASTNVNVTAGSEQGGTQTVSVGTSWQRYTKTFNAVAPGYSAFTFYNWGGSESRTLYIRNAQIHKGGLNTTSSNLTYGDTLGTSIPSTSRTGYTFTGWYDDPITGNEVSSSTPVPSTNTTYYAHWTANNLTFSNQTLSEGTYGTAYTSGAFTAASNGTGSYTYAIKSGAPTGATINSTNRTISFTNSTNAGTYNVVVTATDNNSNKTKDATMTIVINQENNPTTFAAVTGLKYGSTAAMVTVTNKTNIPYYAVDTELTASNYSTAGSTTIPTASSRNAGTYTVYYYIPAAGNYKEKSGNVSVTIGKATNSITLTCASLTYTGSAQNLLSAKSATGGDVYIAKESLTSSNYTTKGSTELSGAQGTDAGSYKVYAYTPGNANYNAISTSKSCSIAQANNPTTFAAATGLKYGSTANMVTVTNTTNTSYYAVGTQLTSSNYSTAGSTTIPTAASRNAGTYTVYYYIPAAGNYKEKSGSVSVTIGKATNSIALTCASLTYTGSAQNLLSAKSATGGDVYIAKESLTSSNYTTKGSTALSGAQGTDAGSYTVYAYTPGNSNYEDKSTSKSCSIAKATPVITLSDNSINNLPVGMVFNLTSTVKSGCSATVSGTLTATSQPQSSGTPTVVSVAPSSKSITNANNTTGVETTHAITALAGGYAKVRFSFTPTDTTNFNSAEIKYFGAFTQNEVAIVINQDGSEWYDGEVSVKLYQSGTSKYTLSKFGSRASVNNVAAGTYDVYATKSSLDSTLVDTGVDVTISTSEGTISTESGTIGITMTIFGNATGTINYNTLTLNKGSNVTTVTGAGTYLSNQSASISATAFTTGYHFNNWTKTTGNTPTSTTASPTTVSMSEPTELTANAALNTYTIAFNNNSGSGSMTSLTNKNYGTSVTLTANSFTRSGYTFVGWNTKADGSGTAYLNSASMAINEALVNQYSLGNANGTITLYAQWIKNGSVKITGVNKVGTQLTASVTAPTPTPSGYTYQWYRGSTAISGATSSTYTTVAADIGSTLKVIVTANYTNYSSVSFEDTSDASNNTYAVTYGIMSCSSAVAKVNNPAGGPSGVLEAEVVTAPSPTPTSYTYQWYRGSSAISGATSSTYTTTSSDVGSTIKVRITGVKTNYVSCYFEDSIDADNNKSATVVTPKAVDVYYDNTNTGMTCETVQCALDNISRMLVRSGATNTDVQTKEGTDPMTGNDYLCKRATASELHTETCSQTSNYCYADGYYASGSKGTTTITYGSVGTSGTLTTGDAFICDINGDGTYNATNEMFYYVGDYYDTSSTSTNSDYATLIYYNNVVSGSASTSGVAYDSSNNNWYGPRTALTHMPTTISWQDVGLYKNTRAILNENGGTTTSGGTLPTAFSYKGSSSRLITYQEVYNGCYDGSKAITTTGGLSSKCNFLFENTNYSSSSTDLTNGPWFETPDDSFTNYVYGAYSYIRSVDYFNFANYTSFGSRPVIEVLKSDIDY